MHRHTREINHIFGEGTWEEEFVPRSKGTRSEKAEAIGELEGLADLRDQGTISDGEFEQLKKGVLN